MYPDLRIDCVDMWEPSGELNRHNMTYDGSIVEAESEFDRHMSTFAPGRLRHKIKDRSINALAKLIKQGLMYDVVYIDGAHDTLNVLSDALLGWVGRSLTWTHMLPLIRSHAAFTRAPNHGRMGMQPLGRRDGVALL